MTKWNVQVLFAALAHTLTCEFLEVGGMLKLPKRLCRSAFLFETELDPLELRFYPDDELFAVRGERCREGRCVSRGAIKELLCDVRSLVIGEAMTCCRIGKVRVKGILAAQPKPAREQRKFQVSSD